MDTITMGVLVAVIMGINQVVKQYIGAKFIPLLSLALGIVGGLYVLPYEGGLVNGIVNGLMLGLSACGVFDLVKKTFTPAEG